MAKLICKKGDYSLYHPHHSWDMNYHLVNEVEKKDYLIDIDEVYDRDEVEDEDDFGGMYWDEFKVLDDIDTILEYAWKVLDL